MRVVFMPIAATLAGLCSWALAEPADLSGVVVDLGGNPVIDATVIVWTADPKEEVGILCPSCYPDCAREGRTDAQGRFTFEGVDGELEYTLMVARHGLSAKLTGWIDPQGGPARVTLEPRPMRPADPRAVLEGRVVNEDGGPVAFATVQPESFNFPVDPKTGGWHGTSHIEGADEVVVTDEHGRFSMYSPEPLDSVTIRVSAPRMAPTTVHRLATGAEEHTVVLGLGATIRGRVVDPDGVPVGGIAVGACGSNRRLGEFAGRFSVGTDEFGRFELANLPPHKEYAVHSSHREVGHRGAIEPVIVPVGVHGDEVGIGDVVLGRGVSVSGRVVMRGGSSVPSGLKLLFAHELAWDSAEVLIPSDGLFTVRHLPSGQYSVSVAPRTHWRLSARNQSYEQFNRILVGRVDQDIAGIVIELESAMALIPQPPKPGEQPLRGLPPGEIVP